MAPLSTQLATPAALPATQSVTVATEVIILNPSNPATALNTPLGPFTALEQTIFDLVASGFITTRAAGTIALGLYAGASATVVAGNLLHKTAAPVTQNTTTAPWWIHAMLIYDSVSGKLQGKCGGTINNVIDPEIANTNVPTGISNAANPVATFSLSITSSGAAPGTPTTINVQKFNAG
jgi:hypothetical protein